MNVDSIELTPQDQLLMRNLQDSNAIILMNDGLSKPPSFFNTLPAFFVLSPFHKWRAPCSI